MKRVRIVVDQDPMSPREWDNAGRMICWHDRYNLGDDHNYDCEDFIRQLAFEADSDCEDTVDRLEDEVWERIHDCAITRGSGDPSGRANQVVEAEVAELIESAVRANYVILPLYLYDHSGITMSTGPFCLWDSGQVGWIICDNETIKREFNGDRDLAEKCLRSEVETYDQYLTGNVYGFIIEEGNDNDGWEHVDSSFDHDESHEYVEEFVQELPDDDDGWEETDSCFGFYGSDPRKNGMADYLSDELIDLAVDAEVE